MHRILCMAAEVTTIPNDSLNFYGKSLASHWQVIISNTTEIILNICAKFAYIIML